MRERSAREEEKMMKKMMMMMMMMMKMLVALMYVTHLVELFGEEAHVAPHTVEGV